ncbi:MAG: outer membrane protein assembly factor BamB [Gammaproteobacteria bacterium]|jgi:outer membrane protein assembly factor BamB|nr:outer membrane protein assembly factor BamB [Gammaproteobacteria bacterium]
MRQSRLAVRACIAAVRGVAFACAAGLLVSCSSKDIDPDELPAELVKFEQSLKVDRIWRKSVGDSSENLRLALRPATDGTNVYAAAHDGKMLAVEAGSGKRVWRTKTGLQLSAGPSTDGKMVVAGSSNGEVVALSAATGEVLWTAAVTSEVLAPPALAGNTLVVQTVNGKLTALAAETGEVLWSIQRSMPRLSVRGTSAPVVARNLIITGFDNGRVAAFDIDDGGEVWDVLMDPPTGRTELDRLIDINARVIVAGNDVYAVGYQGRLGAIALESGQLLWSQELSSGKDIGIDVGSVFVADQFSELVSLSRASGRELWRRKDVRNRDITGPAVMASSVVVGDFEGYLHWFDLESGVLQARARAGSDRITSQPLVLDDTLYVMTDGGDLCAFRIKPPKLSAAEKQAARAAERDQSAAGESAESP